MAILVAEFVGIQLLDRLNSGEFSYPGSAGRLPV